MEIFDLNNYMAEMVYEYIPNVKRAGNNKLNFRCPICGDGKSSKSHRGWFYIDTGSYYCWNAGCPANESGMSGLKFLSVVSGKSIQEIKEELIKRSGSFKKVIKKEHNYLNLFDDEKSKDFLNKIKLNEWSELLPDFVKKYIDNRKLLKAPYLPKNFNFYYDKKIKRLVIPWNNTYYQERTILKSQKDEPKYKFPEGIEKPIFGLENLDKNFKYIFLLEGVFDSIWVKNGVAVGSLNISNHQKELLSKYKNDYKFIYMPDNQFADKSSLIETIKICKNTPFENVFIWPKELKQFKDVNESIIYSDKFINLWKNENFLKKNISNGITSLLLLK